MSRLLDIMLRRSKGLGTKSEARDVVNNCSMNNMPVFDYSNAEDRYAMRSELISRKERRYELRRISKVFSGSYPK